MGSDIADSFSIDMKSSRLFQESHVDKGVAIYSFLYMPFAYCKSFVILSWL